MNAETFCKLINGRIEEYKCVVKADIDTIKKIIRYMCRVTETIKLIIDGKRIDLDYDQVYVYVNGYSYSINKCNPNIHQIIDLLKDLGIDIEIDYDDGSEGDDEYYDYNEDL